MSEENKTRKPSDYWMILPSSTDWMLNVVDPEGRHGAYIKGSGSVHIWDYDHQKYDMSSPSPTRWFFGEGKENYIDEEAEYRMIDIDDEILRLLALRETAIRHFSQYGHEAAQEEWYDDKPLGMPSYGKHIPIKLEITCPLCSKYAPQKEQREAC